MTVSGFRSGARPSTRLTAAAYIPATPRAVPTPPIDVGPSARTARVLTKATKSVGGVAFWLKATPLMLSGATASAASSSACSGVGDIGSTSA